MNPDGSEASLEHESQEIEAAITTPADKATGVAPATNIVLKTEGSVTTVALTAADGTQVATTGSGDTWTPTTSLGWSTAYTVHATVTKGRNSEEVTSSFTTAERPDMGIDAYSFVADGQTVGVGLPLEINFDGDIPTDQQAAVERRMFVTATPATEGSWYWLTDRKAHWRPREYWKPGTTVAVRIGIGGMDLGNVWGMNDLAFGFTIGKAVVGRVDNATKTMTVTENGVVIKQFPISLGKESTPTSSGTMVAISKDPELWFDSSTYGVPIDSPEGYRTKVYWDVRFTWGGEFVHSAPWSVGDQGSRNVSHGCVNAAPENAEWYYNYTTVGDLIIVEGTERQVSPGDGWTDWNLTWEQYLEGSALH